MSLIAILADVHLGNHALFGGQMVAGRNDRCRAVERAFVAGLRASVAAGASRIILAGDLLDTMRPTPQILAAVASMLSPTSRGTLPGPCLRAGRDINILPGNHDRNSDQPGDHALGVLGCVPGVTVHEGPASVVEEGCEIGFIPFHSDARPVEAWLPEAARQAFTEGAHPLRRVLIMHQGIKDDTMPAGMRDAGDAIHINALGDLCCRLAIDVVLAGHWHAHRTWQRGSTRMIQIGALCPTGFGDPGFEYGGVILYDTESGKFGVVDHVPGPRFLTLTDMDAPPPDPKGCELYVRYVVPPAKLQEASDRVQAIVASGKLAGAHAETDDALVEQATRAAAQEAASAETLEQALAGYVAEMPLSEGVERPAVLVECRRFLGI